MRQVTEVLKSMQTKEQKEEQVLSILSNNPHLEAIKSRIMNCIRSVKQCKWTRDQESKIFIEIGSSSNIFIAKLPIRIYEMHIIGTRMLCHGHNAEGKKKLIVYDIWNPDSVRKENVRVTEINPTEKGLQ